MSFGGSASAMNQSVQANQALRKGRNNLFERPVQRSFGNRENIAPLAKAPMQVRERFRKQLKREQRMELRNWALSIALAILFCYLAWAYGNDIISLIVYERGVP